MLPMAWELHQHKPLVLRMERKLKRICAIQKKMDKLNKLQLQHQTWDNLKRNLHQQIHPLAWLV